MVLSSTWLNTRANRDPLTQNGYQMSSPRGQENQDAVPGPSTAPPASPASASSSSSSTTSWVTTTYFRALIRTHTLNVDSAVDPVVFMISETERACDLLKVDFLAHKGLKFNLVLNLRMSKIALSTGEIVTTDPHFSSLTKIIHNVDEIRDLYNQSIMNISENIENFNENGSNFNVDKVLTFVIRTAGYRPLSASSYIPLPRKIKNKKACINLKNKDDKCFLYAVLLALNIDRVNTTNCIRNPKLLLEMVDQLDFSGITYPVKFGQLSKVENQNPVAITIIGYDMDEFFPLRTSPFLCDQNRLRIDLLFLKQDETDQGHYVFIRNLDKLLSRCKSKKNGRKFVCRNCFHQFSYGGLLTDHEKHCLAMKCQKLRFPPPGENFLFFKHHKFTLKRPYLCIADFEMFIEPMKDEATSRHRPMALAYLVIDENGNPWRAIKVLHGKDCAATFLRQIKVLHEQLEKETHKKILPLTHEQQVDFMDPTSSCLLCSENIPVSERVAHHSHTSGEYLGMLCSPCNLQLTLSRDMVVAFHNGSNYDFAEIVRALRIVAPDDNNIHVIAKNSEKFTSITWSRIRFIDSYNLLSASLASLASTLEPEDFKLTASFFPDQERFSLVTQKMLFPYSYFKSASVLQERSLPPREEFCKIK
ncbi:hypothetical protein ONE63_005018 [Megalurothrips usitatus]|uniref:DNA-directed DNA polymerase n=1 Tax=Megalurothrips usitatus TaxID=439358 RepID=A0AAV7X5F0_9NEOP|nr:hypothetical protein ONE63_005018 [Megalurothrips usitatus]